VLEVVMFLTIFSVRSGDVFDYSVLEVVMFLTIQSIFPRH